ncbi:MAG: sigma-54 dependent transcriptional regulator [Desulfobacterales bacterium]
MNTDVDLRQKPPRILIVDDEEKICLNCVKILSRMDCMVEYALNGYDALKRLELEPFDLVITDLKMSSLGGMEVLRRVKEGFPETVVIVITGYSTVSSAVEVMKSGAFDYLPKPFTPHELRAVVMQALVERDLRLQNAELSVQSTGRRTISHQLVGNSPKIKKVIRMVEKVAPTDSTVLIYGESGTGKELIARAVHANSLRKEKVFFAVDCGTLSGELLENELFGHVKGAYTGAYQDKQGLLKRADGGTVFLDEISNISLDVQGKLLRFLEAREFIPRGATAVEKVDIRLVFATNRHLKELVDRREFREDFYYRIYVYPIFLPPLRERKTDILPIAYHFLHQFNRRLGKTITGFDDAAAQRLTHFDWPGNVRQLRNVLERAAILCECDQITLKELPIFSGGQDFGHLVDAVPSNNEELKRVKKEIRKKATDQIEANFIRSALERCDGNITQAARETGLQRTNFQSMMKKHGILLPGRRKNR